MKSEVPVGILLEKDFIKADTLFFPVLNKKDLELLPYVEKFIRNNQSQVNIWDKKRIYTCFGKRTGSPGR